MGSESVLLPSFGQDTVRFSSPDVSEMLGRDLELNSDSGDVAEACETSTTSSGTNLPDDDSGPPRDSNSSQMDKSDSELCFEESVQLENGAG